jgi:hypothetical protein
MTEEKVVSLSGKRASGSSRSKREHKQINQTQQKQEEVVVCSFCNRPNTQVLKMIQGPGVNICSECTMIAVQYLLLEDRLPSGQAQKLLDAFWNEAYNNK